jgi:hypothetical protein
VAAHEQTQLNPHTNTLDHINALIQNFKLILNSLLLSLSFHPIKVSLMKPPSVPMIVVICCGCCFLQSTIAFVILLPNIYIRRCYISINFAIMQFCLSISAMMAFIILGLLKFLPQVSVFCRLFGCFLRMMVGDELQLKFSSLIERMRNKGNSRRRISIKIRISIPKGGVESEQKNVLIEILFKFAS